MSWLDKNGLADVISKMKTYARSLFKIGTVGHPGMLAPDGTSIIVDENGTISSTNTITVDNAFSTTSTNPLQNNVITESINDMNDSLDIVKAHAKATGNVHNLTPSDLGISVPVILSKTIPASGWETTVGKTVYNFESEYPFSQYDLIVEPDGDSITDEQLQAWSESKPVGSPTQNQIILKGTTPDIDIPVMVKVVRK